jgi:hypothetical protein
MTVQSPESLVLDGQKHYLMCFPPLPESHPRIIDRHVDPAGRMTACWRGYHGTWQITEGRFYLVGVSGRYELQGGELLFADWFTGTLCVARGEIIERTLIGFGAVFEEELHIDIEDGIVTETRVIDNRGKQRNAWEPGPKILPGSENESANGDERGIGCGRIVALSFVAVVWMLMTFLAAARGRVVEWPALLSDESVIALATTSATLLVIVVLARNEIAKGNKRTSPKCGGNATAGRCNAWQFIVAICFFPLGLLALLAGRQPAQCPECNHSWQARNTPLHQLGPRNGLDFR